MKGPIDFAQRLLVHGNDNYPVYYYQLSYVSNYALHLQDGILESGGYLKKNNSNKNERMLTIAI